MNRLKRICACALAALAWLSIAAYAADVVFIDNSRAPSALHENLKRACLFYGLQLESFIGPDRAGSSDWLPYLREHRPTAVVATARSLAEAAVAAALKELRTSSSYRPDILVADVDSATPDALLEGLSAGAVSRCVPWNPLPKPGTYGIPGPGAVTGQLNDHAFDVDILSAHVLVVGPDHRAQPIIRLSGGDRAQGESVFVLVGDEGSKTYFLSSFKIGNSPYLLRPGLGRGDLLELLPVLMFLRAACGERCWHSSGHFANLIIDDPWLREPYGHLRYKQLLAEMEKANFHTTIAFVPWNYDRSRYDLVSLFISHPNRFSICIHGNNHDHREFSKDISIQEQERDIIQGLARMEAFTRLTGVPYDRVMVYPHEIGTKESLRLLAKFNFLATANGDYIPAGEPRPPEQLSLLRNYTIDYSNILSLDRADAKQVHDANIALELFLENPILLYSHHDLFLTGPQGFNTQAEIINRIEPSILWTNLGTIARRLYLKRRRFDGAYDVLAFCREIEISNLLNAPMKFWIQKPDSAESRIRASYVNGSPSAFELRDGKVCLTVEIPPLSIGRIEFIYENDLDLKSIDIATKSRRVRILRKISDFRDITLSSNFLGRFVTRIYYGSGLFRWGGTRLAAVFGLLMILFTLISWRVIRSIRRRKAGRKPLHKG